MDEPITVRPERLADIAGIRAVHDAAFGQADEGRIVDGIRGTADWVDGGSLVATDQSGSVVGHVLLSRGWLMATGLSQRPIWMLGPIGVLPDSQRRGVGTALMQTAIELAIAREQPLIALLGHASYYPRFGFEPARALGIEPLQPWPDAHWQVLRLPAWSPDLRGTAHYPAAFDVG